MRVCFEWTDFYLRLRSVLLLLLPPREVLSWRFFPAAAAETLCIFHNTFRKRFNSETPKELPVLSSCGCVSRACGSPVFDFRYPLGQLGCVLLRDISVSIFLRPSRKILGFSWCSLSSLWLHLWDVLVFFLYIFIF